MSEEGKPAGILREPSKALVSGVWSGCWLPRRTLLGFLGFGGRRFRLKEEKMALYYRDFSHEPLC